MTETVEVRTIDASKALELLHQAVATRSPEFNYRSTTSLRNYVGGPSCRYEYDGKADCLIGTALALFGVPIEALRLIDIGETDSHAHDSACSDDCGDASIDSEWAQRLLEKHGHVTLTCAAAEVFRAGQACQDTGGTWGDAEADAIQVAERQVAERLGSI